MYEHAYSPHFERTRNSLRTLAVGLGVSALALVGAHVSSPEAPNNPKAAITAMPEAGRENPHLILSFSDAVERAEKKRTTQAAVLEARHQQVASRAGERRAISERARCWDGDASDFNSTKKEYYKYIYRACELAEDQPWAEDNFSEQMDALINLWDRESGWNPKSDNPNSTAYGIPQALPGRKMGKGWQDDPEVQIKWGLRYITERYDTPIKAWQHFQEENWY